MAGRKPILINLKATTPSGDVKFFSSFPEAAREMGFSEYGVRKAYYSKRNRIGEYKLEWSEPILEEIKAVTSCSTHKIDQQETDG